MKRRIRALIASTILLFLFPGCTRLAVRMSSPLVAGMTHSIFEECDPLLAREAIPANLKVLEGLSKTAPADRTALTALSMGFAGYALLFLEDEDPGRASRLYTRSRDYALRAFGERGRILMDREKQGRFDEVLSSFGRGDIEPLFWASFSWNAWINLNLDNPEAVSQLGAAQACLERVLVLDRSYFHGLPAILQGALLAARPQLLGGELERARLFFQNGLDQSNGRFFPAYFYFARYYAVAQQDRDLFRGLLSKIVGGDPRELEEMCLVNTVFQQKAAKLLAQEDELFF